MLKALGPQTPQVDPTAWVADDAVVVGDVTIGPQSGIWYTTVVRGDGDPIRIGARTNVQDGCVLHSDPGVGIVLGDDVSVGHRAVLHGCVIEDLVLIGMGAIVMNRARIGTGSIVAAGALVTEDTVVPPGSLVMGSPAKVRRLVTEEESAIVRYAAEHYVTLAELHSRS